MQLMLFVSDWSQMTRHYSSDHCRAFFLWNYSRVPESGGANGKSEVVLADSELVVSVMCGTQKNVQQVLWISGDLAEYRRLRVGLETTRVAEADTSNDENIIMELLLVSLLMLESARMRRISSPLRVFNSREHYLVVNALLHGNVTVQAAFHILMRDEHVAKHLCHAVVRARQCNQFQFLLLIFLADQKRTNGLYCDVMPNVAHFLLGKLYNILLWSWHSWFHPRLRFNLFWRHTVPVINKLTPLLTHSLFRGFIYKRRCDVIVGGSWYRG